MITPKVTEVKVRQPYILEVTFEDGVCRTVDLQGHLTGKVFEPLKDPEFFATVSIDPIWHTLVWPNGADLAPEFLYEPQEVRT